jgi:2-polyprenyl-3-methyl-5-hydroxy-6-metoxy-1,4-benzoquinol methylase
MGEDFETVETVCVCGALEADWLDESEGLPIGGCRACGHIRTLRRARDYESLYVEGERYHVQEMEKIGRDHYTDRFEHDYEVAQLRIPKLLGRRRSLDVGCANGAFVQAMQERGFRAEGLELNPGMARWAAAKTGAKIHTSWETVVPWFDYVTYHDCLEHVVDVNAELQRVRRHMRPGAMLVVDQPDAAQVFGPGAPASHHKKSRQHLHYFTAEAMSRVLERNGFVVDDVQRPLVGKIVHYAFRVWA